MNKRIAKNGQLVTLALSPLLNNFLVVKVEKEEEGG